MKLTELYQDVSRKADTEKVQINAADVSRVLAVLFDTLIELDPAECLDVVAKGLASAKKRLSK